VGGVSSLPPPSPLTGEKMTREQLEIMEAQQARDKEELQKYNEQNHIQWLRDVKPKWTEEQVLISAGKKFKKNFLPEKVEPKRKPRKKVTKE